MSKYVDIEVRVWQRLRFTDSTDMNKLVERLKAGDHPNYLADDENYVEYDSLVDTEVLITPEQNEGNATIEVYDNDKMIWNNEVQNKESNG